MMIKITDRDVKKKTPHIRQSYSALKLTYADDKPTNRPLHTERLRAQKEGIV